jgi:hypothetical protein
MPTFSDPSIMSIDGMWEIFDFFGLAKKIINGQRKIFTGIVVLTSTEAHTPERGSLVSLLYNCKTTIPTHAPMYSYQIFQATL